MNGPGKPLSADVLVKITTILDELKDVQDESISMLSEAIRTKIVEASTGFDYDFWFKVGWKPVEQPEVR